MQSGSAATPCRRSGPLAYVRPALGVVLLLLALLAGACDGGWVKESNEDGPSDDPTVDAANGNDIAGQADGAAGSNDCLTPNEAFVEKAWAPIFEKNCVGCHHDQGLAKRRGARLIFKTGADPNAIEHNRKMVDRLVTETFDDPQRLVRKPTRGPNGETYHYGGKLYEWESAEAESLREYIEGIGEREECSGGRPIFDDVELVDGVAHLRKATLALADRPPTASEMQRVREDPENLGAVIEGVLEEEAFLDRLRKYFDLQLTKRQYCSNAAKKQRKLYGKEQACWWGNEEDGYSCKTGRDDPDDWQRKERASTKAICQESVNTIAHIVDNDLSFKKVLTADWTIVNPYSARSYGVFDQVYNPDKLEEPPDPENYRRAKLPQPNREEPIPHAGVISDFSLMAAVGTNFSNRHRHRIWWLYEKFFGTDILQLAPEDDINALAASETDRPLIDRKECAVCHHVLDPPSGMLVRWGRKHGHFNVRQNWERNYWRVGDEYKAGYWNEAKTWSRGYGTEDFRSSDAVEDDGYEDALKRGTPWLGKRMAEDPRFAAQSVRHAYHLVTGEEPLELPTDTEADDYRERLRAHLAERALIDRVTEEFRAANYDFKVAVREIALSDFFRAVRTAGPDAGERTALERVGTSELLTPQQMHRRLVNLVGVSWKYNNGPLLLGTFRVPFGGVDATGTRKPMEEPNAVWAGALKRLTYEVGCEAPAKDFARSPEDRLLFPHVEPSTTPESGEEAIRKNVRYLHRHLLGEQLEAGDPAADATYELFREVQKSGVSKIGNGKGEELLSQCQSGDVTTDPNYTIRAWQVVMTYLMSDYEFWYD